MGPNEITGANAGGPRRLLIRKRWAARIAQFRRYAFGSHLVFVAGHFLHLLSSMIRYSPLGLPFGSGKMAGHIRSILHAWRWHNKNAR